MFNVMFNSTLHRHLLVLSTVPRRPLIDPNELRTAGWQQQAEIRGLLARCSAATYEVPISYHGAHLRRGQEDSRVSHARRALDDSSDARASGNVQHPHERLAEDSRSVRHTVVDVRCT